MFSLQLSNVCLYFTNVVKGELTVLLKNMQLVTVTDNIPLSDLRSNNIKALKSPQCQGVCAKNPQSQGSPWQMLIWPSWAEESIFISTVVLKFPYGFNLNSAWVIHEPLSKRTSVQTVHDNGATKEVAPALRQRNMDSGIVSDTFLPSG